MEKNISGFILIDKPQGMSSHDVVLKMRQITQIEKIGHSGTLDPLATGLLILGIGKNATKNLSKFQKLDKEYIAKIKLGALSNTFDKEGKIKEIKVKKIPEKEDIEKILKNFLGKINQIPPPFSAKKIKGKKAYELARKNIKIKPEPIEIEIYELELLNYFWPYLEIKVHCSSGTYIRTLAQDIGEKLGCGGYLEELRRLKIGKFSVEKAVKIDKITQENWPQFLFQFKIE